MTAPVFEFLADPISPEVRTRLQRWSNADDVRHVAIMPDVHPAGPFCVGMVIGTEQLLYPAAVGGDIGCGIAACRFASETPEFTPRQAKMIFETVGHHIPIGRQRRAGLRFLPDNLSEQPLSDPMLEKAKRHDGLLQLGTLGTGNHFLELQFDQQQKLWAMVHTGSRAMGQAIFQFHFRRCMPMRFRLPALHSASAEGRAYLADMRWARLYAAANRQSIMSTLSDILAEVLEIQPEPQTYIDCDHNHLALENHGSLNLWVHRKGANAAALDQPGLIPGSMGTESFHVTGRGNVESLNSSSHGAGRRLSRGDAMRRISPSHLDDAMHGIYYVQHNRQRLCAEAPAAYRDIRRVMRAQGDLVRIVRQLRPVLNYKSTA